MDADEAIEKNDLVRIKNLIENAGDSSGFQLEQRSYSNDFFEGALKNDSGFHLAKGYQFYISNFLVRLFKNGLNINFRHRVHEMAEDSLKEKNLKYKKADAIIHHFGSAKNKESLREKAERYSDMVLKQLEEEPNNERYNYQAARMYLGRTDFGNALKCFEKAARINPGYKMVFSEIAKIYLRMNDRNRAAEYFKKSMKHNPEDPSPANNLAVVYISMGKFRNAKNILEEQLKRHPDNKALKFNYDEAVKNTNQD